MKVLAITPTFYPNVGGIETVVKELAIHLKKFGIKTDIAHVAREHKKFVVEEYSTLKVYRVPLYGHRLVGIAPALFQFRSSYDLLHIHDPQLLYITANTRFFLNNTPAILSTHGGFKHTDNMFLLKKIFEKTLLKLMLSHYKMILTSSKADDMYFRQYSNQVELCENGIDVNKFKVVDDWSYTTPKKNTRRWIYWGRLSKNKRLDVVIDYIAELKDKGVIVDLLVCGADFDNILSDLERKVDSYGLGNQIKFISYISDQDLIVELNSRGVFITASEYEGFGLTVIEAMAAGMVVIIRNIAPLNTFVEHSKSGFILNFDFGDDDEYILNNIISLDLSELQMISSNARSYANRYDWHNASQAFLKMYQKNLS